MSPRRDVRFRVREAPQLLAGKPRPACDWNQNDRPEPADNGGHLDSQREEPVHRMAKPGTFRQIGDQSVEVVGQAEEPRSGQSADLEVRSRARSASTTTPPSQAATSAGSHRSTGSRHAHRGSAVRRAVGSAGETNFSSRKPVAPASAPTRGRRRHVLASCSDREPVKNPPRAHFRRRRSHPISTSDPTP